MSNDFFYNYRFGDDDKISHLPASAYDDPGKNTTRSAYRGIIYDESIIENVDYLSLRSEIVDHNLILLGQFRT